MLSVLTGCIWIVHTWTVVGCHDRKYGRSVCTLDPWLGLGSIFRCGVAGGHTSVPVKSNWQAISIIPHSARPCQYRLSKHQPAQYFPTEEFLPDGHFEHEPGSLFVSRILNGENGWKLPNTPDNPIGKVVSRYASVCCLYLCWVMSSTLLIKMSIKWVWPAAQPST